MPKLKYVGDSTNSRARALGALLLVALAAVLWNTITVAYETQRNLIAVVAVALGVLFGASLLDRWRNLGVYELTVVGLLSGGIGGVLGSLSGFSYREQYLPNEGYFSRILLVVLISAPATTVFALGSEIPSMLRRQSHQRNRLITLFVLFGALCVLSTLSIIQASVYLGYDWPDSEKYGTDVIRSQSIRFGEVCDILILCVTVLFAARQFSLYKAHTRTVSRVAGFAAALIGARIALSLQPVYEWPMYFESENDDYKAIALLASILFGVGLVYFAFTKEKRSPSPCRPAAHSTTSKRERLFISYCRSDIEFVRLLHDALTYAGFDCFLDEANMRSENFCRRLLREIRTRDRVVLVLSSHSMQSQWIALEARWTVRMEEKVGKCLFAPLRIVPMDSVNAWTLVDSSTGVDIAQRVRTRQIYDFTRWSSSDDFRENMTLFEIGLR